LLLKKKCFRELTKKRILAQGGGSSLTPKKRLVGARGQGGREKEKKNSNGEKTKKKTAIARVS